MKKVFLAFAFFALFFLFADKSKIFSSSSQTSESTKEFQAAFGSQKGDSRYNSQYDTNADGRISAVDYLPLRQKNLQKGALSSPSETPPNTSRSPICPRKYPTLDSI